MRSPSAGRGLAGPLLAVAAVAAAARVALAGAIPFPTPEDTAYYVMAARNLVEGRGLTSDALWSYVTPPLVLPRPAFEIWLPLPTLLAAPLMAVLGTSLGAAQPVAIAAGVAVAVVAGLLAADLGRERGRDPVRVRTLALGAGLVAGVSLPLLLHGAIPDSTMLFGAFALLACREMSRPARGLPLGSRRLLGLGLLIGLAALTRNEAAWLGLAWLLVAARLPGRTRRDRALLVAVPGVTAALVYLPWALRQLLVFGSPFPGQAALNALSVTGTDIFAWSDPPTLARYLDQGLPWLLGSRLEGLRHDLVDVLAVPGFPVALVGLVALATAIGRTRTLRPLAVFSILTFLITSLVFPVSTTWGTFLHAAAPIHVLLVVAAGALSDDAIAAVGRRRRWHRPTAWLGQALLVFAAGTLSLTLAAFVDQSRGWEARFGELRRTLPAAGVAVGPGVAPVITDFPIWYATALRSPALALPAEDPASVLDLARRFGARHLLIVGEGRGRWPSVLDEPATDPALACFREVTLPWDDPGANGPVPRLWTVDCP